jgi:5-methylcytosine-specific restriction protein B
MSRYCGKNDSAPILSAANQWKDEAFLADGSVFDSRALWTVEGLEALETHFVRNLDEGGGTFIAKLEGQPCSRRKR